MPTAVTPAPPPAPRPDDTGPGTALFAVVLVGLVAVAFPEVVSGDHTFLYRDYGLQTYPAALHFRRSVLLGELPLWNPYSFCGLPFLAQWSTGVLYPPALLHLLVPPPWGLGLFCLAHVVGAGLAMYALARSWVGDRTAAAIAGVAWAFGGLVLSALEWPAWLAVLAWAPLVWLTVERAWREGGRRIPQAALVSALQLLGGAPELILLTWLALVALCAGGVLTGGVRPLRAATRFVAVVALAAALSAVQLLPFLELVALSDRGAGFGDNYWAMPAWGVANLLVPLFHTARSIHGVTYQFDQELVVSYYPGIGALALALLALRRAPGWRVFLLAGLGAVALVMAMGSNAPLFDAVRALVPQLGYLRYPVKFVFLAALVVPILAAFGAAYSVRRDPTSWRGVRFEVWTGLALLVAIAGLVVLGRAHPTPGEAPERLAWSGATRALLLCALVGGVLALPRVPAGLPRRAALLALLGLFALDTLTHATLAPTAPVEVYAPQRASMSPVPRLGASRAMLSRQARRALLLSGRQDLRANYRTQRRALLQNTNLLSPIPKVDGHFWLLLGDFAAVYRLLYRAPEASGLTDFLGVSQVLTLDDGALVWRPREGALPIATGGQRPVFGRGPAALVAPGFDPRRVVHLSDADRGRVSVRRAARVAVAPARVSAHALAFDVDAEASALVVIAQAFHPAWRARVDGEAVPLLTANHAFQAVEVPAGRHRLELRYEDRAFRWGAGISLVAWSACLAWLWLARGGREGGGAWR